MKNIIKLSVIMTVGTMLLNIPVFADGLVFDPESYPTSTGVYTAAPATINTKNVTDIKNQVTRENNNMQDALFKLDSAQTDIRNQLLDDRAKYNDIDNKYKAIKEQRKIQKKLVRDGERRINKIEKNKNQIRKLMQVQQ